MALEDAVVLGKALRDNDSAAAACSAYERLRRPRVAANIATSARLTAHRPAPGDPPPPTAQRSRVDDEVRADLDWATPLT
jgi:2-polyprenyl-6-methoxyphenol hydroxylase-like FAD-dependent oxidoreductase